MAATLPAGEVSSIEVGREHWVVTDLRRLAAVASAGLLLGFLVNGWGSRLAMMLLARLNPDETGVVSDDGFTIGRFDPAATANLLLFATAVGVLGALIFLALRGLRLGPRWFGTLSMSVGAAVVVGSQLVHTDGIDFRLLEPVWLAIALFVALPGVFVWAMVRLGDRWLRDDSWFMTGSRWRLLSLAPLALAAPVAPLLLVGAAARLAYQLLPSIRPLVCHPWTRGAARLALAGVFVAALVDLVSDLELLL